MEKPRKSQISIAESNLTSRSASNSDISDSSYASEPSIAAERSQNSETRESRDALPTNPSPIKKISKTFLENPRNSRNSNPIISSRSNQSEAKLDRAKMTTPYGQILSKNGYVMVVVIIYHTFITYPVATVV